MATILALNVTDADSVCFGGEVPILVYDATTAASSRCWPGRGRPRGWRRGSTSQRRAASPAKGIEAAAVPAALDACLTALDRYGTRTFAEVVAPTLRDPRPARTALARRPGPHDPRG